MPYGLVYALMMKRTNQRAISKSQNNNLCFPGNCHLQFQWSKPETKIILKMCKTTICFQDNFYFLKEKTPITQHDNIATIFFLNYHLVCFWKCIQLSSLVCFFHPHSEANKVCNSLYQDLEMVTDVRSKLGELNPEILQSAKNISSYHKTDWKVTFV